MQSRLADPFGDRRPVDPYYVNSPSDSLTGLDSYLLQPHDLSRPVVEWVHAPFNLP